MVRTAGFVAPLLIAIGLLALSPVARTQGQAGEPPELVFQYPAGGETFNTQIPFMQMCFAEPINNKDHGAGGDFEFSVIRPDGRAIGHVAVFQSDAYGVVIERMSPVEQSDGDWLLQWRVTNPDDTAELAGEIAFSVDSETGDAPLLLPNSCASAGGTQTPPVTQPPATGPTREPTGETTTPLPAETSLPTDVDDGEPDNGDDGGSDTLLIILVIAGISGAAGVLAAVLLRQRFRRPGA